MEQSSIHDHYDLLISLLHLERQLAETEAALRQAKYDLRDAKVAQTEYGGSFRSFRDKLKGRREEAETALHHAVQKAEAALASAQREKDSLDSRLSEIKGKLASLPDWEALKDGSREWHRLEALYCMETLVPLLEINHELLLQRRAQFNGTYAGQIKTLRDLAEIYSAPEEAGEACKPCIQRLQGALDALGIPFEVTSYFDGPTAFLSSATQYTRMDRVNTALAQTEKLQKLLPQLQKQLEV